MKDIIKAIVESDKFRERVQYEFQIHEDDVVDSLKEDSNFMLFHEVYGYEEIENELIHSALENIYGEEYWDDKFNEACDTINDFACPIYDEVFKKEFGYYIERLGYPMRRTVYNVQSEHGRIRNGETGEVFSVDRHELYEVQEIIQEPDGWWETEEKEFLESTFTNSYGVESNIDFDNIDWSVCDYDFTNGSWDDEIEADNNDEALEKFEKLYS